MRRFKWEEKDEYGIYRDEKGYARGIDDDIMDTSKDDIRAILERSSMYEHNYICLPEHAASFTQTNLAPELHNKCEINAMSLA